jgi:hypothetical protein
MTIWQAGMTSDELAAAIIEAAGGDIEFVSEAELAEALAAYAPKASPTFTGDVKIPDANADGEALAFDQEGAQLQGSLQIKTNNAGNPEIFMWENDQSVDARRWKLIGFNGELYMQSVTDAGVLQFSPLRLTRAGGVRLDQATSVLVPVPSGVAGQALRWGSNATVAALDATGEVKISAGYPSVLMISSVAPANQKRFLVLNDNGEYILRSQTDAGTTVNSFFRATHAGAISMAAAPSVAVPAATASGQAAQISAIDAATGRLAIGGREMGSTPWRKVLSWTDGVQDAANQIGVIDTAEYSVNGTGYMLLMREGSTVRVSMPNGNADSLRKLNVGQHDLMSSGSVPLSYVCGTEQRYFNTASSYSGTETELSMDSASTTAMWRFKTTLATAYLNNLSANYYSPAGWPTSLPGTAA